MSTDAVTAAGLRTLEDYQRKTSSGQASNLDMDDFLKLFVAQLSYQDPLSSSSGSGGGGTDYISQMAQMTMLQQFSALNNALSMNQAYTMIGKYVYVGEGADSNLVLGKVDGVVNEGGAFYLLIGGKTYELSDVYGVIDEDFASVVTDEKLLQSAGLIGKTVTATVKDSEGEESTVTGMVDKILVEDGAIYMVINDQKIALSDITEISGADD